MPNKEQEDFRSYIANMPVGEITNEDSEIPVNAVDINRLPDGLVTGSNLIQFPANANPEIKSSVSLSLLAAQRVASRDVTADTPDKWFKSHNEVLKNLNWLDEGGGSVEAEFNDIDVAVHEAIIPFLTTAFGGVAAGALIIAALNQLKTVGQDAPWIKLFDRTSRRFKVSEYQFSVVEVIGDKVFLKLAAARLDAFKGLTQVLFIKVSKETAKFHQINKTYSAKTELLSQMNVHLMAKLSNLTNVFIQGLPDDLVADVEQENPDSDA